MSATASGVDGGVGAAKPPNIVWISADQWPAAAVGAYGCAVKDLTPALDGLAAGGLLCERHYTPIPVCAPSRAAMFTGHRHWSTG